DYSAAYWNPAGLAGQGNMVMVEGKFINPMIWLTTDMPDYTYYEGYSNGVEQTTRAANFPAGSFGLTYQYNPRWTFALSAFAPTAIGVDWEGLYLGPPHGYNPNTDYPTNAWYSDLKVFDVHPSFGYRMNDNVRFGAGLALQYSDITLRSPTWSPTGAPVPYDHVYIVGEMAGTGFGVGMNLGFMFDFEDKFNLGISWRSPTYLNINGGLKQDIYGASNDALYAATSNPVFTGATFSAEPDAEATLPIPQDLGVGLAWKVNPMFTLAMDFFWTNWSSVDDVKINVDGQDPFGQEADDTEILLYYEDVIRFNVGFDVMPMEGFHILGGYYYDPTAIPERSLRPSITDVNNKHNISGGLSYEVSDFVIQGYWEHLWSPERETELKDANSDGEMDNVAGTWKMQVDTFGLTIGYKF
ncbi:hypothetical protein GF324_07175, partial [bacterium]|nr:hypothetical protein [bacterium]